MWGGVFSCVDCGLLALRQKEDAFNPIIAGFITGGVLGFRAGPVVAFKNAVAGGVILALLEGSGLVLMALQMRKQREMMAELQKQQQRAQKSAKDIQPPQFDDNSQFK